jgi:hypothetical protein
MAEDPPEDPIPDPEPEPEPVPDPPNYDSILLSVKKLLGIDPSFIQFDPEIIMHINSAFSTLLQLGIGPIDGFSIEDDTSEWASFIGDRKDINNVKSYIYLKVRLIFDPPQNGYLVDAIKAQIAEAEWRLCSAKLISSPDPVVVEGGESQWENHSSWNCCR